MSEPNLQSGASGSEDSKTDIEAIARALQPMTSLDDHLPTTRMPSIVPPLPPVRPPPVPKRAAATEATVKIEKPKAEKLSAARASIHDGWVALRTQSSFVTLRHVIGATHAVLGAVLLVTSFVTGLFSLGSAHASDATTTGAALILARAAVAIGGMVVGYALLRSARFVLLSKSERRKRVLSAST